MRVFQWMFVLVIAFTMILVADEPAPGKISGYMFGDYYWVAQNHNSDIENMNGFWLRRVYFTYDKGLSDAFSMRLRLEMAHPGDFTSKSTAVPFIKDAYLKYKKGNHQIILGISPTPTWEVVEKVWGYRSVEKTPLDLQKFGSSRDFGVALKGKLGSEGKVSYHLMLANGNSNKSETNKGKKVLLALGFHPTSNVVVEVYGDFDDHPGEADVYTLQGFAAYKTKKARIGVQFASQTHEVAGGDNVSRELGSVFVVVRSSEKVALFARVDRLFDANPKGASISYIPFDETAKATFLVGGLDFTPIKNVHLMPNAEIVLYEENDAGVKPDTDLIPRLTFYYKF
ncbi:MAG: hypothetical protein D6748_14280 [Calditrichaeota bacterium]|nr:MAG: hypothetical protein D6748_14280 [Calditrichota bacterium]